MKINCLSCGYKVDLADAYDDYEGQIKCFACGAILEIKTQEGNVRAVNFVKVVPCPSIEEVFERGHAAEARAMVQAVETRAMVQAVQQPPATAKAEPRRHEPAKPVPASAARPPVAPLPQAQRPQFKGSKKH